MPHAPCPISREQFRRDAKALDLVIQGSGNHAMLILPTKEFSTGSLGWYASQRVNLKMPDGTVVTVQAGLTLTLIGSKELPK